MVGEREAVLSDIASSMFGNDSAYARIIERRERAGHDFGPVDLATHLTTCRRCEIQVGLNNIMDGFQPCAGGRDAQHRESGG